MKKTIVMAALVALSFNTYGYELENSVWRVPENVYMQTYENKTFMMGIADAFDREMDTDKEQRHVLTDRIFKAIQGFHRRMVQPGKAKIFYTRISNSIDYMVIPIVEADLNASGATLNTYSTLLRKNAIDAAKGKIWAGGKDKLSLPVRYGDISAAEYQSRENMGAVAKESVNIPIVGVQMDSFSSELLTIFQAARKFNVEMKIIDRLESLAKMSDAEIEDAVVAFNKSHTNTSGTDHPLGECYGVLDAQKPYLLKATLVQKMGGITTMDPLVREDVTYVKYDGRIIPDGFEYLKKVAEFQKAKLIPSGDVKDVAQFDSPYRKFKQQYPNEINRPAILFPDDDKCLLSTLKQYAPDTFRDYERGMVQNVKNFFKQIVR
ncbi:hypothetical protein Sulku_2632 (plasmid) [Sulfuricurvum kujiense DSM 16994]|uniref:Uncharacterized protein n=1 Tax=Sulfuricurvum kujiense (strain ATCC BAA-921 / DSM 16994 / JCM 11577 / YK-1) TaxID=709032 RepID=E4U3L9_SULKY|nr:hypothetical protein [Sulfuricurvum kujiense]ADR35285.1 hypothetical protein Sulku_2632 [Sulfuricurvum kujiense DSM 16994]